VFSITVHKQQKRENAVIGPFVHKLAPKGSEVYVFRNYGKANSKIAIENRSPLSGGGIEVKWQKVDGASERVFASGFVQPGEAVVFTVQPDWYYLTARNISRDNAARMLISYE
jgi:hypothetical protein